MSMEVTNRYGGTLRYIRVRWPFYLLGYGGVAALIAVAVVSSLSGDWAFVALALAVSIVLVYFCTASLWAAHQLYDDQVICHRLFDLGQLRPGDTLITVSPGLQTLALDLSRRMTTGEVVVVDIYNPDLTPGGTMARSNRLGKRPDKDSRLTWRDGAIDLLPMPDNSVETIIMVETASALWQGGDRSRLLGEIRRILRPGGRLLFGERTRTSANILVLGPGGLRLRPADYWHSLIQQAGLQAGPPSSQKDLMHLWLADKPSTAGQQPLPLDI